jgi:hypothetical protein
MMVANGLLLLLFIGLTFYAYRKIKLNHPKRFSEAFVLLFNNHKLFSFMNWGPTLFYIGITQLHFHFLWEFDFSMSYGTFVWNLLRLGISAFVITQIPGLIGWVLYKITSGEKSHKLS